jgi:thiamine biosynthesis lipoprotein ApbE
VLLAYPGTLAELRNIGYKTFSPMIDETYDTVVNDDNRFEAVWKEISRLLQKTPEEWIKWQGEIKSIVEYNRDHFYSNKNYHSTKNVLQLFDR